MSNQPDTQLQSIDHTTLTPMVQQVLGSDTVEVTEFQREEIHGGYGGGEGVYRFTGTGRDGDDTIPWSLILKVIGVRPEPERNEPSGWGYWKREVLAYQSGLLDDLPGRLVAPRCFGVSEHPGGQFWLWLEDIRDEIGPTWPLAHYGVVARHLGQFNGAYLMGLPAPSQRWLTRSLLRSQLARPQAGLGIARLHNSLDHPPVRHVFSRDLSDRLFRLWAQRDRLIEALEQLPQTFCHMDAFRLNLFAGRGVEGGDRTVAIDWAFTGRGAVGEEIAPLVGATLVFGEVEHDRASDLGQMVFDGYLEGLREAGWHGDPRVVRFGYTATSALRYGAGYTEWVVSTALDREQRARWAQIAGCSTEGLLDHLARWLRFLLSLGDEAWELLDEL